MRTHLIIVALLLLCHALQGQRELPPFFQNASAMPLPQWAPPIATAANSIVSYDALSQQVTYTPLPHGAGEYLPQIGQLPALQELMPQTSSVITPYIFSSLSLVTNTSTYPWVANVRLSITFPNGQTAWCSGAMIDSKHILTCGHCVHDAQKGGWATQITVVPGYNNGASPVGTSEMINMTTFNSWINNQNYDFDVAVVRVNRPVGALSGWLGYGWNTTTSFYTSNTFHNPGYPGSPAYNGQTMQYWYGNYDLVVSETPRHNNQGYGGQSGSNSWVYQNNAPIVHALLSHGTSPPQPVWTGHVRLDQNKYNTILNYVNNHTPSQPDLIPLLANASPTTVPAGTPLSSFSFYIHNYSSSSFNSTVQFKVYLSTNSTISSTDTEIWSGSISSASITAKGTTPVNISSNLPIIPSNTPAGNYYVGVLITTNDANDSNNGMVGWDPKPITVSSAGSPNATCANAAAITCGQTLTGTTSGSAQNVPSCTSIDLNTAPGLWYRYTASQTGQVTVTTCNSGTTFDTKIGVFSGSCTSLVCVGANDDDPGCSSNGSLSSTVQFSATSGQTYHIYVTGFQTATGTFQLSLNCAATLSVSPATISQTAAAGAASISVASNCSAWTVSGAPTWATVSPTSGSNNGTINITFQANTSTQSRSANLTIAGCSITRTVSITQAGAAVALDVSPTTISQTAAAGAASISVASNCSAWTVSGAPTWATVSPTSGSNNGTINITFQANTSTQSRSANLTIAGCSITRTVSITQAGAAVALDVSPTTISQTAAAGAASISVASNCSAWTVSGAPTWATVSPTSGSNNGTINITFQANTSTQSRSATLTIAGCSIARTVSITQAGAGVALDVSPTTISQTAAAGAASISVASNCSAWTVSSAPTWATVSPTSGSNNGAITVTFQANTSTQSRSATLTIAGCSITRMVSITQAGTVSTIPWTRSITGENHTVIVPATLTATLDGAPLTPGDAIGFFFSHNGVLHCSNYLVLSGQNQSLSVYGNDASSPNKNGFANGENFKVKIYRATTQQEYDAQVSFAPAGTSIPPLTITHTNLYSNDGISMLSNLSATSANTFRIPLSTNWNMISSHTIPADANMPAVFAELTSVVELVKDINGDSYFPVLNINNLGSWQITKGYRVRASADTALIITGARVDPAATPIPIAPGWQIIPYFKTQNAPISSQLADVAGIVELVKNNAGDIYVPGFINNIGDMKPGQGYQLKANGTGALVYSATNLLPDEVAVQSAQAFRERPAPIHFSHERIVHSGQNSTLILREDVAAAMMEPGDEIGVFTTNGILCGAAVFEGRHFAVTIWGDDPATHDVQEGMWPGETYQIRVWKQVHNIEVTVQPVFASGDQQYHADDIETLAALHLASAVKEQPGKAQPLTVFPNPAGGRFYAALPEGVEMVEVRNAKGLLVQRIAKPGTVLLPIETSGYSRGLLLVSAWDREGRRWYARVVLQ